MRTAYCQRPSARSDRSRSRSQSKTKKEHREACLGRPAQTGDKFLFICLPLMNKTGIQFIHFEISLDLLKHVSAGTRPKKISRMLRYTTRSSTWGFDFIDTRQRAKLLTMLHSIMIRTDFLKSSCLRFTLNPPKKLSDAITRKTW